MKVSEAIAAANALRPNTLTDEQKARMIYELDCDVAYRQGLEPPRFVWPETDSELLFAAPHDNIYPLYLAAQIDYYNQEIALYENDMVVFNNTYNDAFAWWRRNNRPGYGDHHHDHHHEHDDNHEHCPRHHHHERHFRNWRVM